MDIHEWFEEIIDSGNLCEEYTSKYHNSRSKKQLVDLALGGRGITYLCEMRDKGYGAPYEMLTRQFAPYINGKYVFTSAGEHPYTSVIYVSYEGDIEAHTTAITLLGCNVAINIHDYTCVHLFVDGGSHVTINCPLTSRCYVDYWNGATFEYDDTKANVMFKNKSV